MEWAGAIDVVAQHDRISPYEVGQMNVYTFKYRLEFLGYKLRQEALNNKGKGMGRNGR